MPERGKIICYILKYFQTLMEDSVISQRKYYNPSHLLNEILKEPDNREEWLGVSARPVSVFMKVEKSERILVVSFLCIINSSQGTNILFFIEHHSIPRNIL